jgi:hypothetical protein
MSQYNVHLKPNKHIQYGYDHAIFYFITVYDSDAVTDTNDQGVILDKNRFTGLNGQDLAEYLMQLCGYKSDHPHVIKCMLDLPI